MRLELNGRYYGWSALRTEINSDPALRRLRKTFRYDWKCVTAEKRHVQLYGLKRVHGSEKSSLFLLNGNL